MFFQTAVTDAGLKHLEGLVHLKDLIFSGLTRTAVTDAGLAHLDALTELEELVVNNTALTDAGLGRLAKLRRLRSLSITNTQVTDAGLKHLKRLPNLKSIMVGANPRVTNEGLLDLKRTFPDLVVFDRRVTPAPARKGENKK